MDEIARLHSGWVRWCVIVVNLGQKVTKMSCLERAGFPFRVMPNEAPRDLFGIPLFALLYVELIIGVEDPTSRALGAVTPSPTFGVLGALTPSFKIGGFEVEGFNVEGFDVEAFEVEANFGFEANLGVFGLSIPGKFDLMIALGLKFMWKLDGKSSPPDE
ncbi:hypothetical protein Tco_0054252 [Tanacetum coccineum]